MSIHPQPATEHLDVLVIGAGISGIGCGYYLQRDLPDRSYAILEARAAAGGTWDLFRYPGFRSDSDLHTFGYEFKPWSGEQAIARGKPILDYLRATAAEYGIDRKVRFLHQVTKADWNSAQARWYVEVERLDTGARETLTCSWLFSAAGYYRYDQGYAPTFPGVDRFRGTVVHPQHWPEKLDYSGKKVVVIGSGATAVTMVPAMADTAAHVTMLQRTPSYVTTLPSVDKVANLLRRLLPPKLAHAVTRRKNLTTELTFWRFCKKFPKAARALLRWGVKSELPKGYPVDEHFNPPYNPWEQRLCLVPDGDLFKALSAGKASIVTDHIETFTERGLLLKSGKTLEADIIVTATGLNLQLFGGLKMSLDGVPVDHASKVAFRGMMLSDVPNFAFAVGYTNASWTLKVSLVSEHLCRILGLMKQRGHTVCCPKLPSPDMPTRAFLDFEAGYVKRALHWLPRQGPGAPWLMPMYYFTDVKMLRKGPVEDPGLVFSSPRIDAAVAEDRFCELPSKIRLCYRVHGADDAPAVMLIAGLGLQLIWWSPALIGSLVARGFKVVVFDNRDAGRSTHVDQKPPSVLRQLFAVRNPRAYALEDMADDTLGLLDHLGIQRCHAVGMSMGGMIAQALAARHPQRVATLTSIFSTTGHRKVGQPAASTLWKMAKPPARRVEVAVARYLDIMAHVGSTAYHMPEHELRAYATQAWARGAGPAEADGEARQIGAIVNSGDRTADVRRITSPTLVIHGDVDKLVAPSGGQATAQAIANARLVTLPGMGHHIPEGLLPELMALLERHLAA